METVAITNSEFVRDLNTKAVLNTDGAGLSRYKQVRRQMLKSNQESTETKERLSNIERDMSELKNLVRDLVTIRKS